MTSTLDYSWAFHQRFNRFHDTGVVSGKSGRTYKVRDAIDQEEGDFLLNLIRRDPTICRTLEVGCAHGFHRCTSARLFEDVTARRIPSRFYLCRRVAYVGPGLVGLLLCNAAPARWRMVALKKVTKTDATGTGTTRRVRSQTP